MEIGPGPQEMKRKSFRRLMQSSLRSAPSPGASGSSFPNLHHHVYVVLLDPAVLKLTKVRNENPRRDPKKPCLYVGMTGLKPEERFSNHKSGIKAARVVKRFGIRLLP